MWSSVISFTVLHVVDGCNEYSRNLYAAKSSTGNTAYPGKCLSKKPDKDWNETGFEFAKYYTFSTCSSSTRMSIERLEDLA